MRYGVCLDSLASGDGALASQQPRTSSIFKTVGMKVFERGWLSSNSVLLLDGGEPGESVLIDSGYCTLAAQTLALVRNALAIVDSIASSTRTRIPTTAAAITRCKSSSTA